MSSQGHKLDQIWSGLHSPFSYAVVDTINTWTSEPKSLHIHQNFNFYFISFYIFNCSTFSTLHMRKEKLIRHHIVNNICTSPENGLNFFSVCNLPTPVLMGFRSSPSRSVKSGNTKCLNICFLLQYQTSQTIYGQSLQTHDEYSETASVTLPSIWFACLFSCWIPLIDIWFMLQITGDTRAGHRTKHNTF